MTSRELVLRTLEFDRPPRIPRQLWKLPWASINHPGAVEEILRRFPDDISGNANLAHFTRQPPQRTGDPYAVGTYIDEWGCIFQNAQPGIHGEVKELLVKTWDDLPKVKPPLELLTVDRDHVNDFCGNTDKFVLAGCCPRPFERLQFIRGTENVMIELALKQPEVFTLLDRIHQFNLQEIDCWTKTDVDAIAFMDDWGGQRSLLISPTMWRSVFKPLYQEYIDLAHHRGKKAFMHSDGYIIDIIPDLIELGLDALNSQIFCMGIDELGKRFKGQITFWGEIDRQNLLPHATSAEIADVVRAVHHDLYHHGGVIAQLEFGPGAKPENILAAFETWNSLADSP